ncbi:MAG: phosphodiester glycosidase family protein, partial [Thermoguttaceae bacterium]|nr:phosphodiester glycosidase family protein [Thermoguttaceae bacterium]
MRYAQIAASAALVLSLCAASAFAQNAAETENGPKWVPMYEGVDIVAYEVADPLMKVIAARIDLTVPGVEFKTTAPHENFKKEERETNRRTTAEFLKDRGLSVAINGNFYGPFNATTIKTEGDANLTGLGVSDGFVESDPRDTYPSFVVKNDGSVDIKQYSVGDDLSDIAQAVSGNKIVVQDGAIPEFTDVKVHPRTAVGFSQDKRYVYFMTIDGRQAGFSVGATYAQVGTQLKYLGAYQGLNLDGGGSTTF